LSVTSDHDSESADRKAESANLSAGSNLDSFECIDLSSDQDFLCVNLSSDHASDTDANRSICR
jgi:hypothetical protein